MKRTAPNNQEISFGSKGNPQDFLRQRLTRFGLSMIVMAICLPLYYLGLFGSVEGLLHPAQLGVRLANIGVSKTHLLGICLSCVVIAVTWNWVYNLVSLLTGWRMTCVEKMDDKSTECGARVTRKKVAHKKRGTLDHHYECILGHKRPQAHFHPVKKGGFGHTLWVISLLFSAMVFYLS